MKKRKRLLLSIDGGGARGLAPIIFLKYVEFGVQKKFKDFSFHKYTDFFAGVSTGGIILANVGYKKETLKEFEIVFRNNLGKIFSKSFSNKPLFGGFLKKPKYKGKLKTEAFAAVYKEIKMKDIEQPFLLISYDITNRKPVFFKSYNDPYSNFLVTDCIDASTSAPSYFPAKKIGDNFYIDGGIVTNNPTISGYSEAKRIWPNDEILVISMGCGRGLKTLSGKKTEQFGSIEWFTKGDLFNILIDAEHVHHQCQHLIVGKYFRVNSKLEDFKVSKSLDEISEKNLDGLKELADKWYEKFGKEIEEAIIELIENNNELEKK